MDIFCPIRDLNTLTERLPTVVCNNNLIERELGLKNEKNGLAYIDTIKAIQYDLDRYLHCKYSLNDIFSSDDPNRALIVPSSSKNNSGTYVLMGTDHRQGTAQFLIHILLGSSSERNRPDFNTRNIPFATIKCRKDPHAILKLTSNETNRCIKVLSQCTLIALSDDSHTIRTLFIKKIAILTV